MEWKIPQQPVKWVDENEVGTGRVGQDNLREYEDEVGSDF